jgi:hypothetical protein
MMDKSGVVSAPMNPKHGCDQGELLHVYKSFHFFRFWSMRPHQVAKVDTDKPSYPVEALISIRFTVIISQLNFTLIPKYNLIP